MAAAVGAVVAVASFVVSERRQRKAAKKQKQAEQARGKGAQLENARARRQQVAQARRLRAQAVAQAEAAGISGGSQIAGVTSSIGSQAGSNISFLRQLEGFDVARSRALGSAAEEQGRAATFQAVGQFATSGVGQEAIGQGVSFFKK